MPYTFTSKFDNAKDALIAMSETSSTIAELTGFDHFMSNGSIYGENFRMHVIEKLASEIADNPPDLENENYPQVPSFSVNAYNFFFRSDKNIGFGLNYNKEDNSWVATISLYLPSRLFRTNKLAITLKNSDIWEQMQYEPKKNKKSKFISMPESETASEGKKIVLNDEVTATEEVIMENTEE